MKRTLVRNTHIVCGKHIQRGLMGYKSKENVLRKHDGWKGCIRLSEIWTESRGSLPNNNAIRKYLRRFEDLGMYDITAVVCRRFCVRGQ